MSSHISLLLRGMLRLAGVGLMLGAATFSAGKAASAADGTLPSFMALPRTVAAACITPTTSYGERAFARDIDAAARTFGVHPSFLRAVVACESNFDDRAHSKAGARGLAQIMPATATELGIHPDLLWLPRYNLYSSAKYIRWLSDKYGNDLDKVLIGYNAGPAYLEKPRPLPAETVQFVARVKSAYAHFLALERR